MGSGLIPRERMGEGSFTVLNCPARPAPMQGRTMNCDKTLRTLLGIADRLAAISLRDDGARLHDEQASVARLVADSDCPALADLKEHALHDRPERALLAWQKMVVQGLEAAGFTPTVASIRNWKPEPFATTSAASEQTPLNPWVDHARCVVRELVARVERSTGTERPATTKPPKLRRHDRQAWQLATLHGMTQDKVAAELNKEHGTTYTQGQVSRMIGRAKEHAELSGVTGMIPDPAKRPVAMDPHKLDLGRRTDKRKPRPSELSDEA